MPPIPILLERRGKRSLKPKPDNTHTSNDSTKVPAGSSVMFTTETGVTGVSITFTGRSPFASNVVDYNQTLQVRAAFDPGNKQKNSYKYRCTGRAATGEDLDGSDDGGSGGEVEIIKP